LIVAVSTLPDFASARNWEYVSEVELWGTLKKAMATNKRATTATAKVIMRRRGSGLPRGRRGVHPLLPATVVVRRVTH
jgi:hypothetical protein